MPARVESYDAGHILTAGAGFLREYDYSLNPYVGCTFGCSYCYAAFFAPFDRQPTWGDWVRVKRNAARKLSRLRRSLEGKTIYMSSATDPYQPLERRLELTRSLLPLLAQKGAHLVVQTRSPLVARDIDLLSEFREVCVNFSVTTDSEDVRRAFEPRNPPIPDRLRAAGEVADAGIPVAITMTPLLPLADACRFAEQVAATGAQRFVVDRFVGTTGHFRAGTGEAAGRLADAVEWDDAGYRRAKETLIDRLSPRIREGEAGFSPDYLLSSPARQSSSPLRRRPAGASG